MADPMRRLLRPVCWLFGHRLRMIRRRWAVAGVSHRLAGWGCDRCDWCKFRLRVVGMDEGQDLAMRSVLEQFEAKARVVWRSGVVEGRTDG